MKNRAALPRGFRVGRYCGNICHMNDILGALFGSSARVKILRLFLSNLDTNYTMDEVVNRSKVHPQTAKKELALFVKIGLLKKASATRVATTGRGKNKKETSKKVSGFIVDRHFDELLSLRSFMLNIAPTDEKEIIKKVSPVGKVKLIIIAGEFIRDTNSRVDIMVVGDAMKPALLKAAIAELEAHMGKELRYSAFTTADFTYRLGVYDRLIRDVLDYPHQILVDKLDPNWKEVNMRKTK